MGIRHLALYVGGSHPVQIALPRETNIRYLLHSGYMWKWKSISLKAPAGRTIYILYREDNIYDNLARPVGSHIVNWNHSVSALDANKPRHAMVLMWYSYLVPHGHVAINYDKTFPLRTRA